MPASAGLLPIRSVAAPAQGHAEVRHIASGRSALRRGEPMDGQADPRVVVGPGVVAERQDPVLPRMRGADTVVGQIPPV
jgi:hypothetical protein